MRVSIRLHPDFSPQWMMRYQFTFHQAEYLLMKLIVCLARIDSPPPRWHRAGPLRPTPNVPWHGNAIGGQSLWRKHSGSDSHAHPPPLLTHKYFIMLCSFPTSSSPSLLSHSPFSAAHCLAHCLQVAPGRRPTVRAAQSTPDRAEQRVNATLASDGHRPPPPTPASSCSSNWVRAEGATALSSGLTALTKLRSINLR